MALRTMLSHMAMHGSSTQISTVLRGLGESKSSGTCSPGAPTLAILLGVAVPDVLVTHVVAGCALTTGLANALQNAQSSAGHEDALCPERARCVRGMNNDTYLQARRRSATGEECREERTRACRGL